MPPRRRPPPRSPRERARIDRIAATLQRTARAWTPTAVGAIARTIYPAALYRTKARTLREICRTLLNEFGGRVPDPLDDLLPLPLSPFCSHCPNAAECPRQTQPKETPDDEAPDQKTAHPSLLLPKAAPRSPTRVVRLRPESHR